MCLSKQSWARWMVPQSASSDFCRCHIGQFNMLLVNWEKLHYWHIFIQNDLKRYFARRQKIKFGCFRLSRLLSRLCSLHCHHCEDRPGIWDGSLKLLWHLDLALWSLLPNHSDKSKLFICRPCLHLSKVGQVTTAFALLHQMVSSWCIKSYQAWKQ